jgi:predicted NBD/HSP70 family sugar kinase
VTEALGRNLQAVAGHNAAVTLDLVRRTPGISQVELADAAGLTPQAISKIIIRLLRLGLVTARTGPARGEGRPRSQLTVVPDAAYAVGMSIDRNGWRVVMADLAGRTVISKSGRFSRIPGPERLMDRLAERVHTGLDAEGIPRDRVLGAGIGIAGPLDHRRGVVTAATNMPGWVDVPLAGIASKRLGMPVVVDKDTTAATIGEYWRSPHPDAATLVVYVGTGIGSGLVLDGRVYRGAHTDAGEFGHMVLDPNGPRCACGRRGCVEAVSSPAAVVDRYARKGDGARSPAREPIAWNADVQHEFGRIAALARAADESATAALDGAGRLLGAAIANAVMLLDVADVILTGPMAAVAGTVYAEGVRAGLAESMRHSPRSEVSFSLSTTNSDIVALGAALLVLGNFEPQS